MSSNITVPGIVVEIREELQKRSNGAHLFHLPIVEYWYGEKFRFKGQIDAHQHSIGLGDRVDVLVDTKNPKVARLKAGGKQFYLLLNSLSVTGLAAVLLGVYFIDMSNLSVSDAVDPSSLIFFVIGLVCLYRLWPLLKRLKSPGERGYFENATAVNTDDT